MTPCRLGAAEVDSTLSTCTRMISAVRLVWLAQGRSPRIRIADSCICWPLPLAGTAPRPVLTITGAPSRYDHSAPTWVSPILVEALMPVSLMSSKYLIR
ncbi:hypothetical protein D3C76_1398140 [compost metagenome]